MLWIKAFHLIFMITWFAGLFYLPRLFVYHTEIASAEGVHYQRFCTMEKKLFWIIMTPGALLTIFFGLWLMKLLGSDYVAHSPWLHLKLTFVFLLLIFHGYLGKCVSNFKNIRNARSARFYRILNEFPTLILFAVILLAVLKPAF